MHNNRVLLLAVLISLYSSSVFSGGEKSWYKNLKGKVGSNNVEINICKHNKLINGFCYYTKYKQPIPVLGDVEGDSLKLLAYSNNSESENFDGVLKNGKFSGTWTHWNETDKTGELVFEFTEDPAVSAMFDFVYVEGTVKLIKGYKDSPEAGYIEACIWPAEMYPEHSFLRKEICSYKNMNTGLTEIGREFLKHKEKYFDGYFEEYKDITKEELEKISYASTYNQEEQIITVIAYIDDDLAVLSNLWYAYTGGAHGNYGTGYRIIDLVNKKLIELKDIINGDGFKILPSLLEKNFRKQNGIEKNRSLEDWGLFTDTIPVTENVCLTPGCLMFSYVPYEIGPYAMGEAVIYIPVEEVVDYLNPSVKKLIGR